MEKGKDEGMTIRFIGAFFIIIGCGGFGLMIAATHRNEVKTMRQLITILDLMECRLQYQLTPLPDLCRISVANCHGILKSIFTSLASELDKQIAPDVNKCMVAALNQFGEISNTLRDIMIQLGQSLGQFDLNGQLNGIHAVRNECQRILCASTQNMDVRLRCYQTLGLCAGVAIAILFI